MLKKIFSIFMALTISFALLVGCKDSNENANNENDATDSGASYPTKNWQEYENVQDGYTEDSTKEDENKADITLAESDEDMFSNRDTSSDYEKDSAIFIELNGSTATASSDSVDIDGSTITITSEATYIISGTLDDGMIIVNADEAAKLQIVFDNVSINSATSATLYIIEADKVFVTLADGSNNTLSNGGEFVAIDDNNIDGTVFSKQDLTFNGSGSLTVTSPSAHGIVCKDDVVFAGGSYDITSASHAIDANDSARFTASDIKIDAGKDGIHTENSDDPTLGYVYISNGNFDIISEGDGISGDAFVQIIDGDFNIVTGGGSKNASNNTSNNWGGGFGGDAGFGNGGFDGGMGGGGNRRPNDMQQNDMQPNDMQQNDSFDNSATTEDSTSIKAIKSTNEILIAGGTFNIDSVDDAIHSNFDVNINGGDFSISTGDDGIHANDNLYITDGLIDITKSYEGIEGLDIIVSGGDITIVASDDGFNAAGGNDSSGMGGFGGDRFGGGGFGGGMSAGNGTILISGGSIYMNASGDGIDANGSLEITGGYTVVCGPTNGDTSVLDFDSTAIIKGGTFIGTGANMMAQTFTSSTQGVISLNVGNMSADTNINIKDSDGNVLVDCSPKLSYQIVVISTPDIVSGESYDVTIGTTNESFTAN